MNAIEFYTALLESLGLTVSEGGVVLRPGKTETPLEINGKTVVLPTKFYLDQNEWSDVHPFHPLCEDALMGQSETLHLLNAVMRISLSTRYAALIKDILTVSTTKELQQQVADPSVNEITMVFPDVKAGAIKSWTSVYKMFNKNQYFSSLYINRNMEVDGKQYQRVGIPCYPILDDQDDTKLLGVAITKKDTAGIRALVGKIIEPIPKEFCSSASLPYFDTIIQYYIAMITRYNEIVKMYGAVIKSPLVPTDWIETFEDIERIRKRIPRLPGNAGVRIDTECKRNAGLEIDDDEAFDNLKVPAKRKRVVEDEDDTPPWEDKPESKRERVVDRKASGKKGGSILNVLHDDDDDRRGSNRRDRDYDDRRDRGRDRGRDRDRDSRSRDRGRGSRRNDRRDDRRGSNRRERDDRVVRRGNSITDI